MELKLRSASGSSNNNICTVKQSNYSSNEVNIKLDVPWESVTISSMNRSSRKLKGIYRIESTGKSSAVKYDSQQIDNDTPMIHCKRVRLSDLSRAKARPSKVKARL